MNPRHADVLIVGGGVIGSALAAELAGRRKRVLVLERAEPAAEASGAAAGMLTPQSEGHLPGPLFDLALESRRLYSEWAGAMSRESGIDVGYVETGLLRCAFDDADASAVAASAAWQRDLGLTVEEREPASLPRAIASRLAPEVRRAFYFPDEGAVHPGRLTRAAWVCAERRGARVRAGVAARRFLLERGECRGVETDEGVFEAEAVVDAAGAWAALDARLEFPIPVEPIRGQILELSLSGERLPTIVSSDEVYLVPRQDGSVLVGSTLERAGFCKDVTAAAVARLLARAERLVPEFGAARFLGAWAGLRPATPDGLPILGGCSIGGLYFAAGHYRNGILLAPATARLMADLLTEGRGSEALAAFSVERFASSPATDGHTARRDRVFG